MKGFQHDSDGIPVLSREDIERWVEQVILHVRPACLDSPSLSPLMELTKILVDERGLVTRFRARLGHRGGRKIRGTCNIKTGVVSIDESLEGGSPRFNFTLAHEIGHFLMHREVTLYDSSDEASTISDSDRDLVFDQLQSDNPRSLIEWQANKFAGAFLLPRQTVPGAIVEKQKELGIARNIGRICLDGQRQNREDYRKISESLQFLYQTSGAAIRIRLRELNLLDEVRFSDLSRGDANRRGMRSAGDAILDALDLMTSQMMKDD